MSQRERKKPLRGPLRAMLSVLLGAILGLPVLILGLPGMARAGITAGYTEFVIPGDANDILTIFDHIDDSNGFDYLDETDGLVSVITIVASGDNTVIYWDHGENDEDGDGDPYDLDPDDPESTYEEKFTLNAGEYIKFRENSVTNPAHPNYTGPDTSDIPAGSSNRDGWIYWHDAGDRVYVVGPSVSVSRAAWPGDTWSGPALALGWEIYPIKPFLTDYTIPVGVDLDDTDADYQDFELVYALVQSVEDANIVQVDDPTTPGVELTTTLQKGESLIYGGDLNSLVSGDQVNAGTHIEGSKPIQVQFVAATTRGRFEARGFNAVPDSLWDNEYYNPVTSTGTAYTDLFLYNPNNSALLINYANDDGTLSGSFTISARRTRSFHDATGSYVPASSGIHLSSDSIFWGIGAADTHSTTYDWGYTLIPESFLTDQYFLGWAPGCSNTDSTTCPVNGSPVYVAAVYDGTTLYVDYNNDSATFDQKMTLNRLEAVKLADPDNDNTSMEVWTDGLPIVLVWGEDPATAGTSSPYLDLGASTLPMPADWMDQVLGIDVTVDPAVVPPAAGERVQFTMTVSTYDFPVSAIAVENALPADFVYVPYDSGNPTQSGAVITLPGGSQITGASADPAGGTGPTLDWTNAILGGLDMDTNETLTITFWAQSDADLDLSSIYTDKAQASGERLEGTHIFSPFDYASINVVVLTIDKDARDPKEVQAGGTATYTIALENIAGSDATDVTVTDTLPDGFTYSAMVTTNGGIGGAPSTAVETDGRQTLTWDSADIGTIAGGGSVLIEFAVDVAASAPPGTHDNSAAATFDYDDGTTAYNDLTVDDLGMVAQDAGTPGGADPEDDEDITVVSLTIDKETDTGVVSAGGTAGFQIYLDNQGGNPITGLAVTDNMPDGFSYTGGTACIWVGTGNPPDPLTRPGDCTYTTAPTASGQELSWDLSAIHGDLASGAKVVIDYDTTVAAGTAPGVYSSTALAYSDQTGWIDDSGSAGWKPDEVATCTDTVYDQHTPACDEAYDEDVEVRSAVLTIDLDTTTPTAVNAAGTADDTNAVYTISVVNTGSADATGVDISQALPAGFTWDSNVSITLTDATGSTTTTPTNTSGTTWEWAGGWTIEPGGSVVVTFEADVGGAGAGTYDSTAYADYDQNSSGSPIDDLGTTGQDADTPNTEDPEADEDVTIIASPSADLAVDINHVGNFFEGEPGTYAIDVTNYGPSAFDGTDTIEVTVTLPTGMTYQVGSFAGTGWSATDEGGQVVRFVHSGPLASGESLPQLTIQATPGASGTYDTDASVTNLNGIADSNGANDDDTDSVAVTVLAVTKSALTAEPWYPGDTVTYQVEVTNTSSTLLTNVTVSDSLPSGVTYVPQSTSVTLPAVTKTFRDEFNNQQWSNNDGNSNWSTNWVEINESQNATRGDNRVVDAGSLTTPYVARVKDNDSGGEGIMREADLGGAASATLTFDFQEFGLDNANDWITADVSGDGGSNWTTLETFHGGDGNQTGSRSYNITAYISDTHTTAIRFLTGPNNANGDGMYMDNVQIEAVFPPETLTNSTPSTLDDGTPPNLVTGGDSIDLAQDGTLTVTFDVTIDADTEPGTLTNAAAVSADGMGVDNVSVTNTVRSLPTAVFLDEDGNTMSSGDYSGDIHLQVTDPDRNTDPDEIDSVTVTITSNGTAGLGNNPAGTDDAITVTLYETGPDTGIFAYAGTDYVNEPYYVLPLYSCDPPTYAASGGCIPDDALLPDDDEVLYVPSGSDPDLTLAYTDADGSVADTDSAAISLATWAAISDFSACSDEGRSVIRWSTSAQVGTLGFFLWRQDAPGGEFVRVNDIMLPALPRVPMGATYRYADAGAVTGSAYRYKLEEVEASGRRNFYGPYEVTVTGACDAPPPAETGYSAEAHTGAAAVAAAPLAAPMTMAFGAFAPAAVGGDAVKISISRPGLYYLGAGEIAGLLVSVADTTAATEKILQGGLSLTSRGKDVAWLAAEEGAGLYFFGTGVDTRYTKDNVYWLTVGPGLQMKTADAPADTDGLSGADLSDARRALGVMANLRPGGVRDDYGTSSADVNANGHIDAAEALYALQAASGLRPVAGPDPAAGGLTFPFTVRGEEDAFNIIDHLYDAEADFWQWKEFAISVFFPPETHSETVTLRSDGVAAGTATIEADFYGVGEIPGFVADMAHHLKIYINGNLVGEASWAGTAYRTLSADFDADWLNDGENAVKVEAVLDVDDGISNSISYLNEIRLTYPRAFRAVNDAIVLSAAGNPVVSVEDFSGQGVLVMNVTETATPTILSAVTVDGGAGNYRASFRTDGGTGSYLAAIPDPAKTPDRVEAVTRSDLRDNANSVDYLVIAPSSLEAEAQDLADYRASGAGGGYDVKLALLEDIYDEFSDGLINPEAIRSFLAFARRYWEKGPRYVVLVGRGTYDWANDLMPPMAIETADGLFASDNWYADVENDDGVPEMAIGRLPVTTGAQLTALIAKIAAYEAQADAAWNKRVLMVADTPDTGGDFESDTDAVAAILSSPYSDNLEKIFVADAADPRSDLSTALNAGALVFNYLGHGSPYFLSNDQILRVDAPNDDVTPLANGTRAPVMIAPTCLPNRFDREADAALGERMLLHAAGGAIASWGPTGLSLNANAVQLNTYLFQAIFARGESVLGDAVVKALRDYDSDTGEKILPAIYLLLGDPALHMPVTGGVGAD